MSVISIEVGSHPVDILMQDTGEIHGVFMSEEVESAEEGAEESTTSDENSTMPQAAALENSPALSSYKGGAYYTPLYDTSNFYSPWGTDSLDTGLGYLKMGVGAVALIALFVFAMPFAVDLVQSVLNSIKSALK